MVKFDETRTIQPPRRAVVTGASSGIGAAFARRLARSGDVLLVARSQDRLLEMAAELVEAGGRTVEPCVADLTSTEGIDRVVQAARTFGADTLVNNAGMGMLAPVLDTQLDNLIATCRLNMEAPMLLSRALVPDLISNARREGGRASLINVASSAAFAPVPGMATYGATKAFLLSFTEALAIELQNQPIDVLALCPGATKSEFGERAGFSGGQLPGATNPETVVSKALASLGRRSTLLTGPERVALGPVALGRFGVGGAIGLVSRLLSRR